MKEIRNNIDRMIMEAIKGKDKVTAEVFKLIKAEFLNWKTAKNAKPLDDAAEITILQKMVKQRQDSVKLYLAGGREDLAAQENMEIEIIQSLLPKIPTREDIEEYLNSYYMDGVPKAQMGKVIKNVKTALAGADGKMVADIVKANLV